jgi:hypothetical protein
MADVNKVICKYIYDNWISKSKSQRAFAIEHNIEESMVRKIKAAALEGKNYDIPVVTLEKICEGRNLRLVEFFQSIGL